MAATRVTKRGRPDAGGDAEKAWYRAAERQWQDEVGCALLDRPYAQPATAVVFTRQWGRIADALCRLPDGPIVEVGCGKGHLLRWLRETSARTHALVGLDLSRAVFNLPSWGLLGVRADGEALPLRQECAAAIVYDGALHHLIDYEGGLREAVRVLAPGGVLVLFEPISSRFTRLMHRVLDPIVFRHTEYESPIDQRYKDAFDERAVAHVLRDHGLTCSYARSDVLAYPLTGCYAGSPLARQAWVMRVLLGIEEGVLSAPIVARVARLFAWRFLICARKPSRC